MRRSCDFNITSHHINAQYTSSPLPPSSPFNAHLLFLNWYKHTRRTAIMTRRTKMMGRVTPRAGASVIVRGRGTATP